MFQNCQNSNRQEIAYSTNGSAGYDTALTPHAVEAICADVRQGHKVVIFCDERYLHRLYALIGAELSGPKGIEGIRAQYYIEIGERVEDGEAHLQSKLRDTLEREGNRVVLVGYPPSKQPSDAIKKEVGSAVAYLVPFNTQGERIQGSVLDNIPDLSNETVADTPLPKVVDYAGLLERAEELGLSPSSEVIHRWWNQVAGEDAIPVFIYYAKQQSETGQEGWSLNLTEILANIQEANGADNGNCRFVPILTQFVPPGNEKQESFEQGVQTAISASAFTGKVILSGDRNLWANNFALQDAILMTLGEIPRSVLITPANTLANQNFVVGGARTIVVGDWDQERRENLGSGSEWDRQLFKARSSNPRKGRRYELVEKDGEKVAAALRAALTEESISQAHNTSLGNGIRNLSIAEEALLNYLVLSTIVFRTEPPPPAG